MVTRRSFLRTTGTAGVAALTAFSDTGLARIGAAGRRVEGRPATDVAADENYWREIQQAFTLDRTIINLNNGGCCPSPRVVHEALKRYLDISSEALQIAQLGIDLKAGDEVLTTDQDYGRMLDTWDQRVRRDGIKLTKVSFPVPPKSMDELADRLIAAIRPATRVLHFCHITNLTGQIFPVRRLCDEARRRGVKTIVDGAHAFAHFPYKLKDLG